MLSDRRNWTASTRISHFTNALVKVFFPLCFKCDVEQESVM